VHRRFLSAGLDAVCTFELTRSTIAVLDVDGVALGWVAFDSPDAHPLTIKFLHVADLVRRRGFGSTLLRHALGHRDGRIPRLTCITSSGAALYRAVAAPALSPGEHASAAEYSRVVEARG
jgi:GNAT superfamily N-acetyltransferase